MSTSAHDVTTTQYQGRFLKRFSWSVSGCELKTASSKVVALPSLADETGALAAETKIGGAVSLITGAEPVSIGTGAAAMFATGAMNRYPLLASVSMYADYPRRRSALGVACELNCSGRRRSQRMCPPAIASVLALGAKPPSRRSPPARPARGMAAPAALFAPRSCAVLPPARKARTGQSERCDHVLMWVRWALLFTVASARIIARFLPMTK